MNNPRGNSDRFVKRTMGEKNGESNPGTLGWVPLVSLSHPKQATQNTQKMTGPNAFSEGPST